MRLPPARATTVLVILTSGVWLTTFLLKIQDLWAIKAGFIPARLHGWASGVPSLPFWITPLSATFAHSGLMHIAFNMVMLAFCGRYVEMIIGSRKFLWLYVIGAYSSAFFQYLFYPNSQDPMIGASVPYPPYLVPMPFYLDENPRFLLPVGLTKSSKFYGWLRHGLFYKF